MQVEDGSVEFWKHILRNCQLKRITVASCAELLASKALGRAHFRRIDESLLKGYGLADGDAMTIADALAEAQAGSSAVSVPSPSSEAAIYRLAGNLHLTAKRIPEAILAFTQAISLEPASAEHVAHRASAHLAGKQYQLAVTDSENAIRLDPKNALAHYTLGVGCLSLKQIGPSVRALTTALSLTNDPRHRKSITETLTLAKAMVPGELSSVPQLTDSFSAQSRTQRQSSGLSNSEAKSASTQDVMTQMLALSVMSSMATKLSKEVAADVADSRNFSPRSKAKAIEAAAAAAGESPAFAARSAAAVALTPGVFVTIENDVMKQFPRENARSSIVKQIMALKEDNPEDPSDEDEKDLQKALQMSLAGQDKPTSLDDETVRRSFILRETETSNTFFQLVEGRKDIGRGGYGSVSVGKIGGQTVAFKAAVSKDPYSQKCFAYESQILKRLHPRLRHRVPELLSVIVDDQNDKVIVGLVLEFVDGVVLHDQLQKSLSRDQRVSLLKQVAGLLEDVHDVCISLTRSSGGGSSEEEKVTADDGNIVHRDVKPDNIMVRNNGLCVLIDFGFARVAGTDGVFVTSHEHAGTMPYLSPEQIDYKKDSPTSVSPVSHATDVYAFGIMMPQFFTGAVWQLSADQKRLPSESQFPRLSGLTPGELVDFRKLVMRCVSVNPKDRPQFRDILDELNNMFPDAGIPSSAAPAVPSKPE